MNSAPPAFWISNAQIVTQNNEREIFFGHLRIENDRISEIRKIRKLGALTGTSKKETVFDVQGGTLFPGLIQTHLHLCQTLFKNQADDLELLDWLSKRIWPLEAAHSAQSLALSAEWGIYELLGSGTTFVLDMGTVRHTEAILQTVKKTGIRANVGKCLMDHPETVPEGLREKTETALAEAEHLFEKWNGREKGRIEVSFAPRFAISCTVDLLKKVGALAKEKKAILHTHASENQKEIEWVKNHTGKRNIEYLKNLGLLSDRTVLAHCIWLDEMEKNLLASSKVSVAHCPSSNLKLASGIAPIKDFFQKKIRVTLGADGAACNNSLSLLREMRLCALLHKPANGPTFLRAQEAWDLGTREGAKALHRWDDVGSLEVGKKADLFCLDLRNPRSLTLSERPEHILAAALYSASETQVVWTMVDGRWVYCHPDRVPVFSPSGRPLYPKTVYPWDLPKLFSRAQSLWKRQFEKVIGP